MSRLAQANRHGFEKTAYGLYIDKDPQAQLIYALDWRDWLTDGDTLVSAEFTVNARKNDPNPVRIVSEGIQDTVTWVELAGGQEHKTYVIDVLIETENEQRDSRDFRVTVKQRSA
jgi:hypothetical protein